MTKWQRIGEERLHQILVQPGKTVIGGAKVVVRGCGKRFGGVGR